MSSAARNTATASSTSRANPRAGASGTSLDAGSEEAFAPGADTDV